MSWRWTFVSALPALAQVTFERDVEPLLHRRCYGCHGAALQSNGLRLDHREAALKGGYSGAAIIPGDASASRLIERVRSRKDGFRMPPAGPPLTSGEIATLEAWIAGGAQWPVLAARKPPPATRQRPWSFEPIKRPPPPPVKDSKWVRNPVDSFVLARLEAAGIHPSPPADPATLLRRLTLDLTGLPPTPRDMAEFLANPSEEAYERAADRLLASPHYGERWARQWLDLARYADSDGYEKDLPRPHAWRWRQWVIDALNAGMPFDRFTELQIAGDLVPGATESTRIATGFHRNTLKNREGGVKIEQTFFEETVDRVHTVSTVWLGLTAGCAQCHDHKYDPITQRDFYQLYAFFDNVEEELIDAPMPGELGPYLARRAEYLTAREKLMVDYKVRQIIPGWEDGLRQAAREPGKRQDWDLIYDVLFQMTDGGHKFLWITPAGRTYKQQEMLDDYFIEWYRYLVPKETYDNLKFAELRKKLRELKASYPQVSQAPAIAESPTPHPTFLRVRGDHSRPGIEVSPGTFAALPPLDARARPTRLDLARWLTSRSNPLTSRVAVNRMWQELFGRGIVPTSEDFGHQGDKPSHPDLLDWLADEFMNGGWRVKRIHKLIVMSNTYRQSSRGRAGLAERDPDNNLLARQRRVRLSAESIRDAALAASGLLYTAVGGRSVFPPQPKGVSDLTYAWDAERWVESVGPERYRRGLYVFFQRTAPYPQLMNFDSGDSNVTLSRRRRSNTPLQALNLLNDPVFLEAARALAARVLQEAPPEFEARLDHAFRLSLSRTPTAAETDLMRQAYERHKKLLDQQPATARTLSPPGAATLEAAAWAGLSRALLNLDEFITRE